MKKTRRILALLLAAMLTVSAAGCGSTSAPASSAPESSAAQPSEPASESEPAQEEVPEEPAYTSLDDFVLFDKDGQTLRTGRDATGEQGIVSTSKYEASKIGRQIIEEGGNAIDAAVAAAFALGLVEPNSSGIGGGGFMTLYLAETGETQFIDFRECAPAAATPDMWVMGDDGKVVGNEMMEGGKSIGVPGEVAGMLYILENYGTMTRQQVLQPTIDLARKGVTVTPTLANDMMDSFDKMMKYPEFGATFLREDGLPYGVGEIFQNPDYASTLELIAEQGADGFYKGPLAEAIVAANNKYDGLMTMEDLANYQVKVTEPVKGTYRGYEILSSPPPSSGGTIVIEILNILENFDLPGMEPNSAEELHLFSEAFKLAYADRAKYMGDPKYVDVPLAGLMNKEYAKTLAAQIDVEKAAETVEANDPWPYEHVETTHYSIADKEGNMVSVTKTVNGIFGSGVCVDGYGFMLNNEMGDFDFGPDKPNSIAGGKVPLSSMSPTVVLKDGKPAFVLGSPGATTIISTVAQVISKVIDHGMTMQEAVDAPRIKGFKENTIDYETRIDQAVIDKLVEMGHICNPLEEWNRSFGSVQAVLYGEDGVLQGAADPRRDGKALGY